MEFIWTAKVRNENLRIFHRSSYKAFRHCHCDMYWKAQQNNQNYFWAHFIVSITMLHTSTFAAAAAAASELDVKRDRFRARLCCCFPCYESQGEIFSDISCGYLGTLWAVFSVTTAFQYKHTVLSHRVLLPWKWLSQITTVLYRDWFQTDHEQRYEFEQNVSPQ